MIYIAKFKEKMPQDYKPLVKRMAGKRKQMNI